MIAISPGKWHLNVPKDTLANLRFRKAIVQAAANDRKLQRGIIDICRQDILFYINTFVWQYNPKKKGADSVGPFITWPFQDRALLDTPATTGNRGVLWCYENNKSMVVEKSREMGASWLFLIFEDWLSIFHNYVQCLNISRSADAVDSKSRNSLFAKLRFMHEHLPGWLLGGVVEEKMYFDFARSRSEITGEASTGRAGVGGRAGPLFVDEFPQIKEDVEVRQRTASTSDCRFFNGTHLGTGTEFYNLTQSPEFVKLQMHWTQHPEKNQMLYSYDMEARQLQYWDYDGKTDKIVPAKVTHAYPIGFVPVKSGEPMGGPHPGIRSPWYDRKCEDIGNEQGVAMELDINAKGSVEQFYSALKIASLIQRYACQPKWTGNVRFHPDTGKNVKLVEDERGLVKMWLSLKDGLPPPSKYKMGVDVSFGTGTTPSCISITDARLGKKVLEYVDADISPKDLAVLAVALASVFCDEDGIGAEIIWEHVGPGAAFGKTVWKDLGYMNVYYKRTSEHDVRERVSETPGWNPGERGAILLLHEDYRKALYDGQFMNCSERALAETLEFKYTSDGRSVEHAGLIKRGQPSGSGESHGDIVVADALSYKLSKGPTIDRTQPPPAPANSWIDPRTFAGRERMYEMEQDREEEAWD